MLLINVMQECKQSDSSKIGQLLLRFTGIGSFKPFYFTIYNKILKQRIGAVEFDVSWNINVLKPIENISATVEEEWNGYFHSESVLILKME